MTHTPFDTLYGELNGEPITLRPILFDSSDYDKEYKKSDGKYIRPTMAITTCPQCGSGIEAEIPIDYNILNPIKAKCLKCSPISSITLKFPFRDPIKSKTLNPMSINRNAFNELGILGVKDDDKQKTCTKINYGLSSFMNTKHSWKSKKANVLVEREIDLFELLGDTISESFDNPMPDMETNN